MVPYFQCMKLVSSSWLCPRTILDQPTTVTLGAPRVNDLTELFRHVIKYNNIFNKLVNGSTLPFISGLIDLINISETLVITM